MSVEFGVSSSVSAPASPVWRRVYASVDLDLTELHGSGAALARSLRDDLDPRPFFEAVSSRVGRLIPHDRLLPSASAAPSSTPVCDASA